MKITIEPFSVVPLLIMIMVTIWLGIDWRVFWLVFVSHISLTGPKYIYEDGSWRVE